MKIIVESQYFPPCFLFRALINKTHCIFEQYEPFKKTGFRNRCVIAGAEGPITLTIPLEKGRSQKTIMKDVCIAWNENWQQKHWRTIFYCYKSSPWFEIYSQELHDLFSKKYHYLLDWNQACFDWISEKLSLSIQVERSLIFVPVYDIQILDCRDSIRPKSLSLKWPHPGAYSQVFEDKTGFIPGLSILDLLFCKGKNASEILTCQSI